MTTRYQIREVATGKTALCEKPAGCVDSLTDYPWVDGSMSCDCNRKLEFLRVVNGAEPDHSTLECGPIGAAPRAYALDWVDVNGVRIIENDKATEYAE